MVAAPYQSPAVAAVAVLALVVGFQVCSTYGALQNSRIRRGSQEPGLEANTGQLAHRRAGNSFSSKVAPQLPGATEGPDAAATGAASSSTSPQRRIAVEKGAATEATTAEAPFAAANLSSARAAVRREEAVAPSPPGVNLASPYDAASTDVLMQSSSVSIDTGSSSGGSSSSTSIQNSPSGRGSVAAHNTEGLRTRDEMYVALCLAVKDEHFYIREWIAHHAHMGVSRIYIYDDASQPPMYDELADFIQAGIVRYIRLDGPLGKAGERQQLAIYSDCLHMFGQQHTWLGMLDADEYVMIMDGSASLPAVLRRYEGYGALAVNWRLFGSSGLLKRPTTGVLQSFTACTAAAYPENVHVKSFVRPERVTGVSWNPHAFEYKEGFFAVNTNFTRVDGPWSDPVQSSTLVINHYALRSREDFEQKLAKGNAMGADQVKTNEFWDRIEMWSLEKCTYAADAGAKVQSQLAAADAKLQQRSAKGTHAATSAWQLLTSSAGRIHW